MKIGHSRLIKLSCFAAIALAWLAVYYDVLWRLVDDWRVDENYSHGFLIPLVSAYAVWSQREELSTLPIHPRWLIGAALMLIAALMLFAGVMGAELYITRLSLVLSLVALTVYFGGWRWLRQLMFPIGLLFFALPVPNIIFNQIAFPLQLIASDYATRAIKLFGIPALREGNVIELAQMKLQVVEACSGIRSLVSLTALAVVYVYFFESKRWKQIALVIAVIPIAVAANAARVAVTGVLAHHYGIKTAEGFMHSFSGLAVFMVAVVLLLALAQALNFAEKIFLRKKNFPSTKPHEENTKEATDSLPVLRDASRGFTGKGFFRNYRYLAMLVSLLFVAAFTQYLAQASERVSLPNRQPLSELPQQIDSWRQIDSQTLTGGTLRELAADDYLSRTYVNDDGAYVYLFIAYHTGQRHRQTFHSPQNCMPGAGWTMSDYDLLLLNDRGEANKYLIEKDGARMLALYWYQGRGKMIAGEYRARLDTIRDAMLKRRTDAALVRVIVPMGNGSGAEDFARKAATDFTRSLLPILPRYVPD